MTLGHFPFMHLRGKVFVSDDHYQNLNQESLLKMHRGMYSS